MTDDDELMDLVNDKDEVIGSIGREEFYSIKGKRPGYIRAAALFIQNDAGRLWVPTRSLDKSRVPGGLDYSVEGHLGKGESYIDAVIREAKEEIRLDLERPAVTYVVTWPPVPDAPYFRMLFMYRSNDTPRFNPDDFSKGEWLTPQEVVARLDGGMPAKTRFRETMELLIRSA